MIFGDQIGQYFSSVNRVIIQVTTPDYAHHNSQIILIANNVPDAEIGYCLLLEKYQDKKMDLLIHQNGDTLDISFQIKNTSDTVLIKNVNYNRQGFLELKMNKMKNHYVDLFLNMRWSAIGALMTFPSGLFGNNPITFDKYSFI